MMRRWINRYFQYVTTVPAIVLVILIAVFPLCYVVYTSFFVNNLMQGKHYFNGIGNYKDLLTSSAFWTQLGLSAQYTVWSVSIGFLCSLAIAYALDKRVKRDRVFKSIFLIPWLIPIIASAIMWKWLLHDVYGLVNYVGMKIGILDAPVNWLGNPKTALGCLILVEIWYRNPFDILILSSGLKRVQQELYEAARADGANAWQVFLHIILPEIRPEILLALVIRTTFALRESGLPFAFTNGGPGVSTETLAMSIYKTTNLSLKYGSGATASVMLLVISVCITLLYYRLLGRRGEEV